MAAHDVAARAEVCGLAVPLQWHNYVISAYLRRNVPIYEVPEAVLAGKAALPADIPRAANAMLLTGRETASPLRAADATDFRSSVIKRDVKVPS